MIQVFLLAAYSSYCAWSFLQMLLFLGFVIFHQVLVPFLCHSVTCICREIHRCYSLVVCLSFCLSVTLVVSACFGRLYMCFLELFCCYFSSGCPIAVTVSRLWECCSLGQEIHVSLPCDLGSSDNFVFLYTFFIVKKRQRRSPHQMVLEVRGHKVKVKASLEEV